jgi:hypothetical protein
MQLIKEVDFRPLDKIIVTFDKFRTYTTEITVGEPAKPGQTVVEDGKEVPATGNIRVTKNKARYNQQVARIVAVPTAEVELSAGDEVLVDFRACFKLDGYKDLYLLPKYNIIGVMWPIKEV